MVEGNEHNTYTAERSWRTAAHLGNTPNAKQDTHENYTIANRTHCHKGAFHDIGQHVRYSWGVLDSGAVDGQQPEGHQQSVPNRQPCRDGFGTRHGRCRTEERGAARWATIQPWGTGSVAWWPQPQPEVEYHRYCVTSSSPSQAAEPNMFYSGQHLQG